MEKQKAKRIFEIVLIIFVILSIGLIMAEMGTNLVQEINNGDRMVYSVQEVAPTPRPTLTAEEREEFFSEPVGEED